MKASQTKWKTTQTNHRKLKSHLKDSHLNLKLSSSLLLKHLEAKQFFEVKSCQVLRGPIFKENAEFGFGMRKAWASFGEAGKLGSCWTRSNRFLFRDFPREVTSGQDTLGDKKAVMSEELRTSLKQYLVMRKDQRL